MTPTPPETSSSGRSPEDQFRVVRKRNRVPLSCYPCRTRKKCDRGHPCTNCVKREGGDAAACSYATPVSRKKTQNQAATTTPDDMQNRIDRLENLVLSLMSGDASVDTGSAQAAAAVSRRSTTTTATTATARTGSASASASGTGPSPDSNVSAKIDMDDEDDSDVDESIATSLGMLKVDADKGKLMYVGQEHWHMLLADISEVKTYFTNHKKELESSYERVMASKPPSAREGPTLLLGPPRATEAELRAGLPSKTTVRALCARYFNSLDDAVNIIHAPTFQKQLDKHWEDPTKTQVMWLGLLYSVLTLAVLSHNKIGDEPPEWKGRTLEIAGEYRLRCVQCLLVADYTKPCDYTVETMILYLQGEYLSRWDADVGLWMLGSLIIRIGFRMGYHRDAKWFPLLTPFQAEMRRRTWALLRMLDVMTSHQVSLPSMIREDDCDTQPPSNIYDEEFGPDTQVMPLSRPVTEATPISYMIIKTQLIIELGNILRATNKVAGQPSYDTILQFDARLREIKRQIPPHLQMKAMDSSQDPVNLLISRFHIDILYQKITCILHRNFIERARHNSRYAHSRRTAINAALETLQHMATLHRETQPNGRLRSVKWLLGQIAVKDFGLAATLVLAELNRDNMAAASTDRRLAESATFWTPEQRLNMIGMLEITRDVWRGMADSSVEVNKAAKVLDIVLDKIRSPDPPAESNIKVEPMQGYEGTDDMQPEHSAAVTLGMLSGGLTPNTTAMLNNMQSSNGINFGDVDFNMSGGTGMTPNFPLDLDMNNAQSPFSMFANSAGGGEMGNNFDWNAFENYSQNANWGFDNTFGMFVPGPGQPAFPPVPDDDKMNQNQYGNTNGFGSNPTN
ncbi:hypothetical protein B0T11DRAFT_338069 [Plectosphaerella cucumerina]|uniref:Zn(2)-C6 fungal-type domain-containing protein n=1 Tax=Plectosphaerella cucumerina TaxID=40658 RepID=A0A8K0TKP7_9PEZI|nr:hypothetical protein B0T11DRAFT_338069 [Plectosphaerella cucumerina]